MNRISRFFAPLLAAMLAGCATADFTSYQGTQQKWPTAPGAFVSNQGGIPVYYGLPPRPYIVLGYLNATTAPIRRREVVEFAARRAKEIGGDAIIVLSSGEEYAGSLESGGAHTNVYGSYASTHIWSDSTPLFKGKASALIIKFK